jgi:hypothetical protein
MQAAVGLLLQRINGGHHVRQVIRLPLPAAA